MKKKLICTAIILTMLTSLTACGGNADSNGMSDTVSTTESAEIATATEAENETDRIIANAVGSANNKDNADNSTNNFAATTIQSASANSNSNPTTESAAPEVEAPKQNTQTTTATAKKDTQTTTEAPATTETHSEAPATTEAPVTTETHSETPVVPATTETTTRECPWSRTGHTWEDNYKTITVTDQEGWEEKIPTGEYETKTEKHTYANVYEAGWDGTFVMTVDVTGMSSTEASNYVSELGVEAGKSYKIGNVYIDYITVTDYDKPIYAITYHPAVTHTERVLDWTYCTSCGAIK